jgi:hypothetical protein
MGIGVSVFLIAVGAVLAFAVNVQTTGIDLAIVGWILMVVGGIGLATTLLLFGDGGWWSRRGTLQSDLVDDRPVVVERDVVAERPVVVEASRRRVTRRRVDY